MKGLPATGLGPPVPSGALSSVRGSIQLVRKLSRSLGDIFILIWWLVKQTAFCCRSPGCSRLQKTGNDLELTPLRPGSPRRAHRGPAPADSACLHVLNCQAGDKSTDAMRLSDAWRRQ